MTHVVGSLFTMIPGGSLPRPGHCRSCGGIDRDCVNFGGHDKEGFILLCNLCLVDAALSLPLGLITVAEMNASLKAVAVDTTKLSRFNAAKRKLKDDIARVCDDFDLSLLDSDIDSDIDTGIKLPSEASEPVFRDSKLKGLDLFQ